MSLRVANGFWNKVGEQPFRVLLVSLILMLLLSPSITVLARLGPVFTGMNLLAPLSLVVIAASALTLWKRARHHAWHMVATGFVIATLMLGGVIDHQSFPIAQLIIQILFLGRVIQVVVKSVFSAKEITSDVLCGAICVYLLTGVLAGLVFVLIEVLAPGSFRLVDITNPALRSQDVLLKDPGWLIYFSFVTLTTVGYGDMVPNSSMARSAAVTVAVLGQILLVVQIARLVGMHVAQSTPSRSDRDEPDK